MHPWDKDFIDECPYNCSECGDRDCFNYKTPEEWEEIENAKPEVKLYYIKDLEDNRWISSDIDKFMEGLSEEEKKQYTVKKISLNMYNDYYALLKFKKGA